MSTHCLKHTLAKASLVHPERAKTEELKELFTTICLIYNSIQPIKLNPEKLQYSYIMRRKEHNHCYTN